MKRVKILIAAFTAILLSSTTFEANALLLPNPMTRAYQYGDAYSYSLPILANYYDILVGGNKNPFEVDSTPGAIKDLIVVATGATGVDLNTNFDGMDDAYATPSGDSGSPSFNTGYSEPDQVSAFTGDKTGSWDTRLSSLSDFLGTGQVPIFYFNNNQISSGDAINQNLLIWGQIALSDDQDATRTRYFDLTNNNGFGGIPGPFSNVYAYNSPGPSAGFPQEPTALNGSQKDFILSGGQLCVNNTSGDVVPCGSPNSHAINHNLGADSAAYAAIFPELNALLMDPNFGGYDVMSIDLRMRYLNNGFEQVFIGAGEVQGPPVPEPGTMVLLGMGMLGLAIYGKRRINNK